MTCSPEDRTPFCGKPGCCRPVPVRSRLEVVDACQKCGIPPSMNGCGLSNCGMIGKVWLGSSPPADDCAEFNTPDDDLNLLLGLSVDLHAGKGNMDDAIWWLKVLGRVLSKMGYATEDAEQSDDPNHVVTEAEPVTKVLNPTVSRPHPLRPKMTELYDLSGAMQLESALRAKLIEMGWTPPGEPQKPVAYLRNLTDPQPHAVTDLRYRTAQDAEMDVQYVPVYASPPAPAGYVTVAIDDVRKALGCARPPRLFDESKADPRIHGHLEFYRAWNAMWSEHPNALRRLAEACDKALKGQGTEDSQCLI